MCYLCPKNIKSPLLNTTFTPIICGISYFEIDRFIRSWCHLWWIYWISFEARMSRYSSHEKTICCWCDPVIWDCLWPQCWWWYLDTDTIMPLTALAHRASAPIKQNFLTSPLSDNGGTFDHFDPHFKRQFSNFNSRNSFKLLQLY